MSVTSSRYIGRRKILFISIFLTIIIVIFLLPISVSRERLVSDRWCSFSYPFIYWTFNDDGSFEQEVRLIDSESASNHYDIGVWIDSGKHIQVVIHDRGLITPGQEIVLRPVGGGRFFWTFGDYLGEGDMSIFAWYHCPSS